MFDGIDNSEYLFAILSTLNSIFAVLVITGILRFRNDKYVSILVPFSRVVLAVFGWLVVVYLIVCLSFLIAAIALLFSLVLLS